MFLMPRNKIKWELHDKKFHPIMIKKLRHVNMQEEEEKTMTIKVGDSFHHLDNGRTSERVKIRTFWTQSESTVLLEFPSHYTRYKVLPYERKSAKGYRLTVPSPHEHSPSPRSAPEEEKRLTFGIKGNDFEAMTVMVGLEE